MLKNKLIFALTGLIILSLVVVKFPAKSADGEAALFLYANQLQFNEGDEFPVDVILDTKDNSVVAVRAIVAYDPALFQLQSWDTAASVFLVDNKCAQANENNPCQIVNEDAAAGEIAITLAKPNPGVETSSGLVATLNFKALKAVNPESEDISLKYEGEGGEDDSDVIMNDGGGTDILKSVTGVKVKVDIPADPGGSDPATDPNAGSSGTDGQNNSNQNSSNNDGSSSKSDHKKKKKKKKKKKESIKPVITSMPLLLNKNRGDKVWWNAFDNSGIAYYKYTFGGKVYTTKNTSFNIPANFSRGLHPLLLRAYDKYGNSSWKLINIWVR